MNRRRKEQMIMFLFMEVEVVSVRIVMDRLTYIVYIILYYISKYTSEYIIDVFL